VDHSEQIVNTVAVPVSRTLNVRSMTRNCATGLYFYQPETGQESACRGSLKLVSQNKTICDAASPILKMMTIGSANVDKTARFGSYRIAVTCSGSNECSTDIVH